MGCCSSRHLDHKSCDELIHNSENYLGLFKCKSIDIDRITHRNSYNLQMSQIQFELSCRNLGINYKDPIISDFFMQIYNQNEYSYSVREFTLLGIFLGIGTKEEKIQLLFQNYDIDASKTLAYEEIQTMLKDICRISFQYLPSLALRLCTSEERPSIEKYKLQLRRFRNSTIKVYLEIIFEDVGNEITMDEFKKLFEKPIIGNLINASSLRMYSKNLYAAVRNQVEAVKAIIANPELIDKEMMDKLESTKLKRKMTKTELG
ncbi:hypothetical protein SteCoe_4190 [Stentor coeruleus]|uniref:EF-hand domain-containing protein n=1 Tax=Stentor coeruleus TaxID=5963 RepID=A0A1R2CVD7_9CILI|nr:hypothetical protein SteCoe_4190 [Stentor coeruleus]